MSHCAVTMNGTNVALRASAADWYFATFAKAALFRIVAVFEA
jgi:hypothetical protein